MNSKTTLLLAAALLLSLPATSAWADKGSRNRRADTLKHRGSRSDQRSGKVRARGGMLSRVKTWQRRNGQAGKRRARQGHISSRPARSGKARTARVLHGRSHERRGVRGSKNRVRYRLSGRRFNPGTINTLIRAGLLRRGEGGQLYVLGSGKAKRGTRKVRPARRFRLFAGRRVSRGELKKLWKLASRPLPRRYPHGDLPLARLWR